MEPAIHALITTQAKFMESFNGRTSVTFPEALIVIVLLMIFWMMYQDRKDKKERYEPVMRKERYTDIFSPLMLSPY